MAERAGEKVEDRQNRFLIEFGESYTVGGAARAAGVTHSTVCRWRREDTDGFAARYEIANEERGEWLEARMFDVLKWATAVEQYDKVLRNPGLLQFALRGAKPERYGDKNVASQDDARRIFEEIAKLKGESKEPAGEGVKSLDDELRDLLDF